MLGTLLLVAALATQAQEKPVPKDSMRIYVPGCSKGLIFTVAPKEADQPGRTDVAAGTHLRMSGPKKTLDEIKAREGALIELTGLIRKGQLDPRGMPIGGRVGISPGPAAGSVGRSPGLDQVVIDVEGWRPLVGDCPAR
jgi:hypothetical protein